MRPRSRRPPDTVDGAPGRVDPVAVPLPPAPRTPDACTQLLLAIAYRAAPGEPHSFRECGFSCFSQTDEDGILLYLFAVLGTTNRLCVEICAGDGIECNTANLIVNHGWHGLLIDGDADNVARANRFYDELPATRIAPPTIAHAWVTRDNVNALIEDHAIAGEIDLLSIDLDGVDYWIWDALTVVNPRIVVTEYQDILGPDRSWTVPYSDDFSAWGYSVSAGAPNFAGASLRAFTNLAATKGYRLVAVNRYGYNAFFVREDVAGDIVPAIEVAACFDHPKVIKGMAERFPLVADHPWVEV